MDIYNATEWEFKAALSSAQQDHPIIAASTSPVDDLPDCIGATFYLTTDDASGFAVTNDGELVGLFSTKPKREGDLIGWAVSRGARRLDCFDGYLTGFYGRHGWREVKRVPNWTPGGPDVVYMVWG